MTGADNQPSVNLPHNAEKVRHMLDVDGTPLCRSDPSVPWSMTWFDSNITCAACLQWYADTLSPNDGLGTP